MKKLVALIAAIIMLMSCTAALAELTVTTGGTSGTYYAFGNVLAQYITNNSDVAVTAIDEITAGGSTITISASSLYINATDQVCAVVCYGFWRVRSVY